MSRSPCCPKEGMNRGAWSSIEDSILCEYVKVHGAGSWRSLPQKAGLRRCGKSCRFRWLNYLRPDIKRGNITHGEEDLIIRLHKLLGNRWSLIAGRLPGRTDNEIKNYWHAHLGKKVRDQEHSKLSKEGKPAKQSPNEVPAAENKTRAVRTKAMRCTKIFATPQPNQFENFSMKVATTEKEMELESYQVPSLTPQEDDSSNFLLDFEIDERWLSDLPNPEAFELSGGCRFCDHGNLVVENSENNNLSSSSSDQLNLLHEGLLKDWVGSDSIILDEASNLQSLDSFLESEKE